MKLNQKYLVSKNKTIYKDTDTDKYCEIIIIDKVKSVDNGTLFLKVMRSSIEDSYWHTAKTFNNDFTIINII